ncbi:hypothetical protein [Litoribrevibacter albus]|uniref:Uncharacterized protein n=1 Tax=Litoribrevibacter albus TaxID=1473156 RepID=A0AA37W670_9GAMM|nr:hypothetical protein [Litoribrevibacter albus]GLQ29594.1 hypothetical protein GCM10007876_00720 [Litoribrevibacter albus]
MNHQITSWITGSVLAGWALCSAPLYALEPLSEEEMSLTTAQNGKALEEEQIEQVLASSVLLSAVNTIKEAVPLEADIELEGLELDGREVLIQGETTEESEVVVGLNELLQASHITIDTIEFNNIRITGSPDTFGSTAVHGLQVDQSVQIQLR